MIDCDIAHQLRRAAIDSRLSSAALARQANVDRKIVARWLSGERSDLRLSTAAALAAALGLGLAPSRRRSSASHDRINAVRTKIRHAPHVDMESVPK